MKIFTYLLTVLFLCGFMMPSMAQSGTDDFPTDDVQIKLAIKSAPSDKAEGAKVLGYNKKGEIVVLRQGTNDLVCLADDPYKKDIHTACYFKELEPFMARGRELKAEGVSTKEMRKIRGEEAASGKLQLPEKPATLFVFDADEEAVDLSTGDVAESRIRSVIYVPYLTGEESGLPTKPVGGGLPWLMDAGTHRAHIMITPAK